MPHSIAPAPAPDSHRPKLAGVGLSLCLTLAAITGAAALATGPASAQPAQQQPPHQLCKPGHNYDQAKGLCYDPAAAYKANIPKDEDGGGGFFSGIGSSLGLGGAVSLCQYGDKHVGWGDDAYCVSRKTGQAYPATR